MVVDARSGNRDTSSGALRGLLPARLYAEIDSFVGRGVRVYEIRLRAEKCASVVCDSGNVALSYVVSHQEMSDILAELCEHSLYAYADTINRGYVTVKGGMRVGVVGRAAVSGNEVRGVYDVTSLCFRLPHRIDDVGSRLCGMLRGTKSGALIYSPPGVGKTTLLRSVIAKLSDLSAGDGAMRVVVVDTRGELGAYLRSKTLCVDVLSGYPREIGIEIAARSLNAELVVCDELCGNGDINAVIQARNSGVPTLATAHAQSLEALFHRSEFRRLHEACAFENYVGISRSVRVRDFTYDIVSWEEAEEIYG